jgi:integrase
MFQTLTQLCRLTLRPEFQFLQLKLLSEYISSANTPEDRPIFGIKRCQVHTIVKKYGKMIEVDSHSHTFRHSFAIRLVRSGPDLRRVQQLLGHLNLNTMQV